MNIMNGNTKAASSKRKLAEKFSKGLDNAENLIEPTINMVTAVCSAVETTSKVAVSFGKFLPLISEVATIFNEIVEVYQAAEHNKRICGVMLDRVQIAETAVKNLKNRRDENEEFFTQKNFFHLQQLIAVIRKIRKFIGEISQLKGLSKYIQAKSIEKTAKELISEFDGTIQVMHFALMIDFNINADKVSKDIKADVEDLSQVTCDIYVYYNLMKICNPILINSCHNIVSSRYRRWCN